MDSFVHAYGEDVPVGTKVIHKTGEFMVVTDEDESDVYTLVNNINRIATKHCTRKDFVIAIVEDELTLEELEARIIKLEANSPHVRP